MWEIKIDSREDEDIKKLFGMITEDDYEVTELTCGDYALFFDGEPAVGVERKRVDDLFSSIKEGRIFHQVDLMIDIYDVNYLAVSRSIGDYIYEDRITFNTVMGALGSIVTRRDFNLIWFEEDDHLVTTVNKIFQKVKEGKYNDINTQRSSSTGFLNSKYYSLIKIPFVHHRMAMELLEKYDEIEDIKSANEEDLKEITGIGEKRSKELKKVIK